MADTAPDLTITDQNWVDLYALATITVGAKLLIANKSGNRIILQLTPSLPDPKNVDGPFISPFEFFTVDAGESGCFLKGMNQNCTVNVQEG